MVLTYVFKNGLRLLRREALRRKHKYVNARVHEYVQRNEVPALTRSAISPGFKALLRLSSLGHLGNHRHNDRREPGDVPVGASSEASAAVGRLPLRWL